MYGGHIMSNKRVSVRWSAFSWSGYSWKCHPVGSQRNCRKNDIWKGIEELVGTFWWTWLRSGRVILPRRRKLIQWSENIVTDPQTEHLFLWRVDRVWRDIITILLHVYCTKYTRSACKKHSFSYIIGLF